MFAFCNAYPAMRSIVSRMALLAIRQASQYVLSNIQVQVNGLVISTLQFTHDEAVPDPLVTLIFFIPLIPRNAWRITFALSFDGVYGI